MISRREFLVITAAAATLSPSGLQAQEKQEKQSMYVALRLGGWWANRQSAPRISWEDMAGLANKVGYGGIHVQIDPATRDGVNQVRSMLSRLKLRAEFLNMPATPFGRPNFGRGFTPPGPGEDDAAFKDQMTHLDDVCAFAAAIGCPRAMIVMPASSTIPKDELRKISLDRAQAMSEIMNKHGMRVGLEFLGPQYFHSLSPYEFIWRMPETVEWCKEAGPNWGLVLDAWHWYHAGATVSDIIAAGKSRIVNVHVSDAKKMPPEEVRDNMRLIPGEGVIDLVGFFAALKNIGYGDGIDPEPLGRLESNVTAEQAAKLLLDATTSVMAKAGISV